MSGNGRRGKGRGRGRLSLRTQMRHEMNGCKFTPAHQPPTVVETPWNSLVLQLGGKGDTIVTCDKLASVLQTQAGFTKATGMTFDYRVHRIRLWGLALSRPVRLSVWGTDTGVDPAAGAMVVLDAWPDRLHFPAIGYEMPRSVSNIVWTSDSKDRIFSVEVSGDNTWLAYLDILWRGNSYTPFALTARFQATCGDASLSAAFSQLSFRDLEEPGATNAGPSGSFFQNL